MTPEPTPIVIQAIAARETQVLRQRLLRPMQTVDECVYGGDDHPEALHLGAFDGEALIGIASFAPDAVPHRPEALGMRLRGMAVAEEYQGQGIGARLLHAGIAALESRDVHGWLWCNARTSAVGFYERQGLRTVGAEFEIPPLGPHFVMEIQIATPPEIPA